MIFCLCLHESRREEYDLPYSKIVLGSSDTTGSMCINVSSGLGQHLSIIGLFKGAIVRGDSKSPYYV